MYFVVVLNTFVFILSDKQNNVCRATPRIQHGSSWSPLLITRPLSPRSPRLDKPAVGARAEAGGSCASASPEAPLTSKLDPPFN
ncbi:hypothetical protein EVAR_93992_1 [Eumeta japonica]|uniref:Uncharacterized protein n=1 Tax=Eumeta variegata TaxID=151549 RepID=A0A4C1TPC8_EUMVA|nr:hypothetical protein EVAR_93992_1 [Eumeta japonica]